MNGTGPLNALVMATRLVFTPVLTRSRQRQQARHLFEWALPPTRHRSRRRTSHGTSSAGTRSSPSSLERRSLYEMNLWVCFNARQARPVPPAIYCQNPSLTNRLIPWLNREVVALLGGNTGDSRVAFAVELVLSLVPHYEICSAEFVEHVLPFFGRRTGQFIHELHAFASSHQDMVTYDRHTTYETAATALARGSPAAPFMARVENRDGAVSTEGNVRDPNQPGPSGLREQAAGNESDDSDVIVVSVVVPTGNQRPVVIELSSDDDTRRTAASTSVTRVPTVRRRRRPRQRYLSWRRQWLSDSDTSEEEGPGLRARRRQAEQQPQVHQQTVVQQPSSSTVTSMLSITVTQQSSGGSARDRRASKRRQMQRTSSGEE